VTRQTAAGSNLPRRWRSKSARELGTAILEAGGAVEPTRNNHYRVTGPGGVVVIGDPSRGKEGGRAYHNTVAKIRRHTGLDVAS
jgi:hypothetical protein